MPSETSQVFISNFSRHRVVNMITSELLKTFIIVAILFRCSCVCYESQEEISAREYMKTFDEKLTRLQRQLNEAQWNYETNINQKSDEALQVASAEANNFDHDSHQETMRYNYNKFSDTKLRRMFEKRSQMGHAVLEMTKAAKFSDIISRMQTIYSSAKICIKNECNLPMNPNISHFMAESREWDSLESVWSDWRSTTGDKMRDYYKDFLKLADDVAKQNNLRDYGDIYLINWEDPDFMNTLSYLYEEIKPFYELLHAYVRKKLEVSYGDRIPKDGTLPAHLLGNMWAQQWSEIYRIMQPYPGGLKIDVSHELKEQNYTVEKIFRTAEAFFTSLGLEPMTDKFWSRSMFERPPNRDVQCFASASDFYGNDDYRIKMCAHVNMEDFQVIHHEMGHIQYFMLYRDQPTIFKDSANPGFHEALGDTILLSSSTPAYFKKIGKLMIVCSRYTIADAFHYDIDRTVEKLYAKQRNID